MAEVARILPRHWDGHRLLRFLTGLALLALAFAAPAFPAPSFGPDVTAQPALHAEDRPVESRLAESPAVAGRPADSPAVAGRPADSPAVASRPADSPAVASRPAGSPDPGTAAVAVALAAPRLPTALHPAEIDRPHPDAATLPAGTGPRAHGSRAPPLF
ncbi:hypothetical protein [Jidongwangia harbinensis]|uniref:hypothetical protein n=1 Tax=Jidongwangia harbinensis TaxID=2878561 RepID=UPI001CD9D8B5|nr:hypothetical protein [Jidongwangia harbinensis]MCA2214853.1 hypothetical protein [Jidongwangia harbinensis]